MQIWSAGNVSKIKQKVLRTSDIRMKKKGWGLKEQRGSDEWKREGKGEAKKDEEGWKGKMEKKKKRIPPHKVNDQSREPSPLLRLLNLGTTTTSKLEARGTPTRPYLLHHPSEARNFDRGKPRAFHKSHLKISPNHHCE